MTVSHSVEKNKYESCKDNRLSELSQLCKVGSYVQKGCYTYNDGRYAGKIWYGSGGSDDEISGSMDYTYLDRPPGFDCRTGNYQRRSNV